MAFLAFSFTLSGHVALASFTGHGELLHSQRCLRTPLSVSFMNIRRHVPFLNRLVRPEAVAVDAVVEALGLLPLEVVPPLPSLWHGLSF